MWRLLDDQGIHDHVKRYIKDIAELETVDDFANLVESRAQIQEKVLDHVATQKNSSRQLSRLKQAWRIANDEYERKRERARGGQAMEDPDAPLDPVEEEHAHESFGKFHHFNFRSHDRSSAGLFGKIFKESQKWTNTFVKIEKVKDLRLAPVVQEPKKQQLLPNVHVVQQQNDTKVYIAGPLQYLHGVRVYCNMLAVAGVHRVTIQTQ